MKHATKRSRAKAVSATKTTSGGALSDKDIVELARQAVPHRMQATARVVRTPKPTAKAFAAKAGPDLAAEVAKAVGTKLPADDPSEVVVRFTDETELGKRYRLVHVRGRKITNVVTRAGRRK